MSRVGCWEIQCDGGKGSCGGSISWIQTGVTRGTFFPSSVEYRQVVDEDGDSEEAFSCAV